MPILDDGLIDSKQCEIKKKRLKIAANVHRNCSHISLQILCQFKLIN